MSYTPLIETWIYPLGGLGTMTVRVSAVDYDLTLPTAMTVRDALAWWAAAMPTGAAFTLSDAGVLSLVADSDWRLTVNESLRQLLGLAATVTDTLADVVLSSGETPLGWVVPAGIGYDAPQVIERAELREYSLSRASAYTSRRGRRMRFLFHLEADDVDTFLAAPLLTRGKMRVYPTDASETTTYSRSHLTGYIDAHPYATVAIDRPSALELAVVQVDALVGGD